MPKSAGNYGGQSNLPKLKQKLPDACVWRKLIFNEEANNKELMEKLNMPKNISDAPPQMGSVDALLRLRPLVFGAIYLIAFSYGMYNLAL